MIQHPNKYHKLNPALFKLALGKGAGNGGGGGNVLPALLAWWKINDGTGDNFADSSGNANTAVGTVMPTWTTLPGYAAVAALMSGNGDNVFSNTVPLQFQLASRFSLSFWANPAQTSSQMGVFANWTSATNAGWLVDISAGNFDFYFSSVFGSNYMQVSTPAAANTTQFVVVTYDGSGSAAGINIYVNGVARTPSIGANSLTSPITYISGGNIGGIDGNAQYSGYESDYRVWGGTLTAVQAATLFAQGPQ